VWGLSVARTGRLWAFPRSWDHGVARDALRLARALRARVGFGPSAVEDWQASQGLEPDGVVGPRTLRSLELAASS
jgi:murein L,D-transpeptidase YcbB/YkuD